VEEEKEAMGLRPGMLARVVVVVVMEGRLWL
jgi:hypothetical protein